jgi:polyisoprenyl-phosphate glycosyltransferase
MTPHRTDHTTGDADEPDVGDGRRRSPSKSWSTARSPCTSGAEQQRHTGQATDHRHQALDGDHSSQREVDADTDLLKVAPAAGAPADCHHWPEKHVPGAQPVDTQSCADDGRSQGVTRIATHMTDRLVVGRPQTHVSRDSHEEMATWPQDARDLAQRQAVLLNVLKYVERDDEIGGGLGKWQCSRVAPNRRQSALASHLSAIRPVLDRDRQEAHVAQNSGVAPTRGPDVDSPLTCGPDRDARGFDHPAQHGTALGIPPVPVFERRQLPDLGSLHDGTVCTKGPELLSIVVPAYNEEDVIGPFAARARPVLDGLGMPYEVLVVDDGSTDRTADVLGELSQTWSAVRVIRLRRNAGHQAAITAGLDHCLGELVVTIDIDLQDPPEVIAALVTAHRETGADVVYAQRADRKSDSWFKRHSAGLFYRLMRDAAGAKVPPHVGDFRLLTREAVDTLRALPERHRVYRLLIPWMGFPSTIVQFRRDARAAGQSKYPLSKMTRLAADSITSFTAKPLRIATWLGIWGSLLCIGAMLVALFAQFSGHTIPGWASVFVAVLFLGAIQLLCLGLLGEYVGRLYAEAQHRPLYYVASDSADRTAAGQPSNDISDE